MIDRVLLTAFMLTATWAVMSPSLLRATIGLAVTSAILTVMMFKLASPLAAVFELSVCTGLITAVFISAISLMKPLTHKETVRVARERIKRYWYLPVTMAIVGGILMLLDISLAFKAPSGTPAAGIDVRSVLWNFRQLDLFGQIIVLLAGVFGVVILFKVKDEAKK
jgi:NADH-quinone oxidoreductase subunit J